MRDVKVMGETVKLLEVDELFHTERVCRVRRVKDNVETSKEYHFNGWMVNKMFMRLCL